MTLAELGQAVKDYRRAHHLSQAAFGNLCGLSATAICRVERGLNSKGEPFYPIRKNVDRIMRVITPNAKARKEPTTMTISEIDERNSAKLRSILLALLNEEDDPKTTPAPVTPPPAPEPTPEPEPSFRVEISYDMKHLTLHVLKGDREVVKGWSYIRKYRDANDPTMDMIAAISYASHMAYKNYEQWIIERGGGND